MIRVTLPPYLRGMAGVHDEAEVTVTGPVTVRSVLDALEAAHPVLRGMIREHGTLKRRALLRYFACGKDLSHEPPDTPLPEPVAAGREPFIVLAAIAGG